MELNWIWFGMLILVILIDIFTSNFTFSWLGIGFIPAFIAGFFVDFTTQIWIALILGIVSIVLGLKISKKYIKATLPEEKLLIGKYEGQEFFAEIFIGKNKEERIKVNEVYWLVKNIGVDIQIGDMFIVEKVDNNKLIIRKGED